MPQDSLHRGWRSVYRLTAHVVLTTKYRHKVLSRAMLDRFAELAAERCQGWKAELLECNGEADHVHLLIDYPPDMAVSNFVANLKTTTSRLLRKDFPALQRHYRKPVLWAGAYFVVSTGGAPIEVLRKYIQGQGADSSSR